MGTTCMILDTSYSCDIYAEPFERRLTCLSFSCYSHGMMKQCRNKKLLFP
ncbi:Uncharacterized protein APZ42_032970 [Daphnia magna]|uniref:Uncharacterized protein n=1 Tax=Daphnia magna TaxID=35525 RepID=A0A164LI22_9CRUS|nr:Uncharacterized protein APZ42_032970 [Daphnia magna]